MILSFFTFIDRNTCFTQISTRLESLGLSWIVSVNSGNGFMNFKSIMHLNISKVFCGTY
jgi:hypothetical protein